MPEGEFKKRVKRLREVNAVVEKLDPAIRGQAFQLLQSYIDEAEESSKTSRRSASGSGQTDAESFFKKHSSKKPADNALAIAAYYYGQYGAHPFTLSEIRAIAEDAGVTIPERLDMTYGGMKREGKSLFRGLGGGKYRPTVHGESHMKETYGVLKGTKTPPTATKE